MIDLLPDAPDPANDIPSVFSQKAAALVLAQKAMVPQINSAIANMNSIAAGGAYSIPITFDSTSTSFTGIPSGDFRLNNGSSQNASTILYVSNLDARGSFIGVVLASFGASSSGVKGQIRLVKVNDPTKWLVANVNSVSGDTTYEVFGITVVDSSAVNPFANNDQVMLYFQRTGDKGDIGSTKIMLLRETLATGTAGPGLTAATWNQRALNTTNWNNISGASLGAGGAGTFRLPPGDYVVLASAVALTTTSGTTLRQAIRLYNRTTSVPYDVSGTEVVNNYTSGGYATARPSLRTALTVSSTTDYSIDHYVSIAATGGLALNVTGYSESYTEVMVLKVA